MRIALYLLMMVVLAPYALLASAFAFLDHALADGTLRSLLRILFHTLLWLIDGGLLALAVALVALLALAASDRGRWVGFVLLGLAALVSAALIVFLSSTPLESGQWLFLAPCLLVAILAVWLARREWRERAAGTASAALLQPREPAT